MDYTFSVASENNETNATQTNGTYWQTIVNCMDKRSKLLTYCVFKQSLRRLDEVIYSNETWQLNSYVSMKKNEGWKPIELEARAMRSPYGQIMSRISDLLTSRSLQFTLPQNGNGDRREARSKYAFGSGGNGAGSSSIAMGMSMLPSISSHLIDLIRISFSSLPIGRKKKHKGMKFSGIALAAMLAQLFLGKIAFLAGVSLLLSKIALLFSIFVR